MILQNRAYIYGKTAVLTLFIIIIQTISFSTLLSEEISSLNEQRREILLYGMDSQILDLLTQLKEERSPSLDEEIEKLFYSTRNSGIKKGIISFFHSRNLKEPVQNIFLEVEYDYFDMPEDVLIEAIRYLSDHQTEEITRFFIELLQHDRQAVANAAIRAIGASKNLNHTPLLLEMLAEEETSDARTGLLIEAIGLMKAPDAVDILTDILTDTSRSASLRWRSAVALGEIGSDESLDAIKQILYDSDHILRQNGVRALRNFPQEKEVEVLLLEAMRDSHWRVRMTAAESLGAMKSEKAVPALIFRVKNDPDPRNTGQAAMRALGEIGTDNSFSFLREYLTNTRTNPEHRTLAVTILVDKDLDASLDSIREVIDTEWDKEESRLLDHICRELSLSESRRLKDYYALMLQHPKSMNLKIYALRGIRLNSFREMREEVERLSKEGNPNSIRRTALSVLEEW